MTNREVLRLAAAAVGLGAVAVLGASVADSPAATTSVVARAHPGAGPTFVAPRVPVMQLGQTEGEPTTTVASARS